MGIKIRTIALLFVITSLISAKIIFYPSLSNVNLDGAEKVSEITSPDKKFKLNIYLYGGVLLKWDYSYIGELENLKTSKKKNILWLPPVSPDIQWIDNKTLMVDEEKINIIKDTFDFR